MGRGCTLLLRVPCSLNASEEAAITLLPLVRPFDRSPKAMMMNSGTEKESGAQYSGRERKSNKKKKPNKTEATFLVLVTILKYTYTTHVTAYFSVLMSSKPN